jgi:hypothetical protein
MQAGRQQMGLGRRQAPRQDHHVTKVLLWRGFLLARDLRDRKASCSELGHGQFLGLFGQLPEATREESASSASREKSWVRSVLFMIVQGIIRLVAAAVADPHGISSRAAVRDLWRVHPAIRLRGDFTGLFAPVQ